MTYFCYLHNTDKHASSSDPRKQSSLGYDSDSPCHDAQDEDDEDEEAGGGNHLMGFMFGNVDNSGDLDVDYLDEDAKEHFAALADKLGTSLKYIDLSYKSLQKESDATDQDYDEKAETAVNYEDFDEAYEGPELQVATEEDFLLPKKEFYLKAVSVEKIASVFDDENYDDDIDNLNITVERNIKTSELSSSEKKFSHDELPQDEGPLEGMNERMLEIKTLDGVMPNEDISNYMKECGDRPLLLPVLCAENGNEILRFSEIFSTHYPIQKTVRRDCRYVIHKEKYTSMDASDFAEEDEETFLRATFQEFPWSKPFQKRTEDVISDAEGKSRGRKMPFRVDEPGKDSYATSEPMKNDASVSAFPECNSSFSPKFCAVYQQNWEDKIIWNSSPSSSENVVECFEVSEMDSDAHAYESNLEVVTKIKIQPHKKDHDVLYNRSILVEPFGTNEYSHSKNSSISRGMRHPQLLRLDSRLENVKSNFSGTTDAINCFNQLSLQNRDVLEGSWSNDIIWEPCQSVQKSKLILDLQDQQMLFELLDSDDTEHLQLHATAMIMTSSMLPSCDDSLQLHGGGNLSAGQFNISNDKFYSNWKPNRQLRPHPKKHAIHGLKVLHSLPALKLQTMKAKLSNKDLANFHRPKALWYPHDIEMPFTDQEKLAIQGAMKIIVKSLGGKRSKLHVDNEETISSLKSKASKSLGFKHAEPVRIYYFGRELKDDKSLGEQGVRPKSVLNLICTKVHLFPRAQKIPGEDKSFRPPGAFKKKSDLSVKDGHVFLMEYSEERPLLLGNAGMGARLCTYYKKSAPGDQMGNLLQNGCNGLGSIVVLDTADKSPFIGDINPGSSQSCLETNMYRTPLFQHKVPQTDYLLVRSSTGKLSIRRIDGVTTAGQQEPHMEVMSPGSRNAQLHIMNRLLVHLYRQFRVSKKRGLHPSIRADGLLSQFPNVANAFLRKTLKKCADMQKGLNGQYLWVMKRGFRIPTEEELRMMVTPEHVCAYESMQAGKYRLKRLGITSLVIPSAGLSSAVNQLPGEAIVLAAASYIERELQITPWNLSSNFVFCTNQDRENIERMEITGVGDPSGRGLGFSYVRATSKVGPKTARKFTHGNRKSSQLQQQTREKCQEIWDRLVNGLSSVDGEKTANESETNSDLDSFAGDLENLLDTEDGEEDDEAICESKHESGDGVKGFQMRHQYQTQKEDEKEDEEAEAAELCRMLMDDEEADQGTTSKATCVLPQVGKSKPGLENSDGFNKNSVVAERFLKPERSFSSSENIATSEKERSSQKKLSRDFFRCGACGQSGHIRTNKTCPNYGGYSEARREANPVGKPKSGDETKLISKNTTQISAPGDGKPKAKFLKVKYGGTDKATPSTSQNSNRSDVESASRSSVKVKKIIFSNKMKSEDESYKPGTSFIQPAKERLNLDETSQDAMFGFRYRKTNSMTELTSFEEEIKRNAERQQHEKRNQKLAIVEDGVQMYEEVVLRESEDHRENTKKKKKTKYKMKDELSDDYRPRTNDRRIANKDGSRKRTVVDYGNHHAQTLKRRRGGEVDLSNILENIERMLRGRKEISYLFLEPVSKKVAPDYLNIITYPMDLSKIRDKARKMHYNDRHGFRHDVYQIAYNAHLYNDQWNPYISSLADQLLELCDYFLDQYDDALTEAEQGVH